MDIEINTLPIGIEEAEQDSLYHPDLLQSLNLAQSLISSGQIKDKKIIDLRVRSHLIVK